MSRKPTIPFVPVLLALLLAGSSPCLQAAEPKDNPAPGASPKLESKPDEAIPDVAPEKNARGGLVGILRARKEERQRQKAEALASKEISPAEAEEVPMEIEPTKPKKAGFFSSVFKKRPRNQPGIDAAGEEGKPESPKKEKATGPEKGTRTEATEMEKPPKKRGFHPPWSQRKESPASDEAPPDETDATPGKKTKKRGFNPPWSQKKEAPESAEAPPAKPDATPEKKTKRRGFRWPWSQRKEAPVSEESTAGEVEAPLPPSSVDPISLLDIKPREPEAALAPSAAPTPPGKKPNPLDDIGLHPER